LPTKNRPLKAFDRLIICEALDSLHLLLSTDLQFATREVAQELMASIEALMGEVFHPAKYDIDPLENMRQFHLDLRLSFKRLENMNNRLRLSPNLGSQIQVLVRCIDTLELQEL